MFLIKIVQRQISFSIYFSIDVQRVTCSLFTFHPETAVHFILWKFLLYFLTLIHRSIVSRRGQAQPFPRSGGEQKAEYLSSWGGVGGDRGGNLDCRSGWGGERVLAASGNISPLMESDRESCV